MGLKIQIIKSENVLIDFFKIKLWVRVEKVSKVKFLMAAAAG